MSRLDVSCPWSHCTKFSYATKVLTSWQNCFQQTWLMETWQQHMYLLSYETCLTCRYYSSNNTYLNTHNMRIAHKHSTLFTIVLLLRFLPSILTGTMKMRKFVSWAFISVWYHRARSIYAVAVFKVTRIAFLCSVAWPFNLDNWIVGSVDTTKVTLNVLEVVMANRLTATGAFSFSSNRQKKLEKQRICSEKQTFIYASKNHSKGITAGLM